MSSTDKEARLRSVNSRIYFKEAQANILASMLEQGTSKDAWWLADALMTSTEYLGSQLERIAEALEEAVYRGSHD